MVFRSGVPFGGATAANREYGMGTAFFVLVADLLLLLFYVCQYRQELGLTVDGSHDEPVRRPPPPKMPPPPPSSGPSGARGRQVVIR